MRKFRFKQMNLIEEESVSSQLKRFKEKETNRKGSMCKIKNHNSGVIAGLECRRSCGLVQ